MADNPPPRVDEPPPRPQHTDMFVELDLPPVDEAE